MGSVDMGNAGDGNSGVDTLGVVGVRTMYSEDGRMDLDDAGEAGRPTVDLRESGTARCRDEDGRLSDGIEGNCFPKRERCGLADPLPRNE